MGKAFVYGDHVDTDGIIPARHLLTSDPDRLAEHCLEDLDAEFVGRVEAGDVIVAGHNFGCGSSREHAPVAIKASGCQRHRHEFCEIFYRNSFNIGLPILVSGSGCGHFFGGCRHVDFRRASSKNETRERRSRRAVPAVLLQMVDAARDANYKAGAEQEGK